MQVALSIDWATQVITVPQAYLTPVTGSLYELDTDQFRRDLKAIEASEEGMVFADTHDHNTAYTVAGVTYARKVEIVNGYAVEFEDGTYSVRLAGSNNNLFDVENGILVQNSVQVIAQNAAGLVVPGSVYPTGLVVADVGNTESRFATTLTETMDDYWKYAYCRFDTGGLTGQVRKITGYYGATKQLVTDAFTMLPQPEDAFTILNR